MPERVAAILVVTDLRCGDDKKTRLYRSSAQQNVPMSGAQASAPRRRRGPPPGRRRPVRARQMAATTMRRSQRVQRDGDRSLRARRGARGVDRVRRQLLADVSHELDDAGDGDARLSRDADDAGNRARRRRRGRGISTIIGDETARLEHIIGDLLELARLEGGGGALRLRGVPVRAAVRARGGAARAGVRQTAGVTDRRRHRAGAEIVAGDRDRLEQALQNLAANALRYAPAVRPIRLARAAGRAIGAGRKRRTSCWRSKSGARHCASTCRTSSIGSTRRTRRAARNGRRQRAGIVDCEGDRRSGTAAVSRWTAARAARASKSDDCLDLTISRLARLSRGHFVADPLAQPEHRLGMPGDERLPFGFRRVRSR